MSSTAAAIALAALLGVGFGVVVPWAAMRSLVSRLGGRTLTVRNYRGSPIAPVLGVAWLLWALALLVSQTALDIAARLVSDTPVGAGALGRVASTPLSLPLFGVPFVLVAGVFALGLVDDAFGAGGPKGFGGHIRALARGRLTTGFVKMAGIGGLALFYGGSAATGVLERSGIAPGDVTGHRGLFVVAWLLAALVIALAANLLNLLDMRPGRALKVYGAVAVVPAALFAARAAAAYNQEVSPLSGQIAGLALSSAELTAAAILMVAVVLGPVLAVWRLDLGERGMLGDAGANTMGAILGYLLTAVLPLVGLTVAAGVLLVLNLASERVSFTAVIERTPVLSWLDRLGRLPDEGHGHAGSGNGGAQTPSVRYHANGEPPTRED